MTAREALQNLVERLDEIHAHPEFKSVWTMYAVHGGQYRGPTWVDALEAARVVLKSGGDDERHVGESFDER